MRATTLTLMTLTLALGAMLIVPTGAAARGGVVSSAYDNLDYKIERAWDLGQLTRWELDELRALQDNAEYVIDRAFRDGRVTGKEQRKIDTETGIAVDMFYLYRDNWDMRYVRPVAPVVIVTPRPYKPVHHVVVTPGHHGHGHHNSGHGHSGQKPGKGGKSHRR